MRRPGERQRVTLLELFFDLAFVFALTQLSRKLFEDLTWNGAFQTFVLLLAMSWIWTLTAWLTDRLEPRHPAVQLVVLGTMVASLVMAAVVPEAFGGQGLVFAAVSAVVHIGVTLFLLLVLPEPQRQAAQRILLWSGVSAALWIAGGFARGAGRGTLWILAAAVDYIAFALRYPTPGLGRMTNPDWPLGAEHLAERHRQFFIIALGELILVTGLTFSQNDLDADHIAAFGASIATTVLFWRIYVHRAGELLGQAIAAVPDPVRLTRPVALAHLVMVAGVVVTAVGNELVITQPLGDIRPAWIATLLGGPVLFVAGRARLEHTVFGRVSRNRPIALLTLLALAPPLLFAPPLLAAVAVALVLTGVAVSDASRSRGHPPEAPAPASTPA
ncbi:low temperature requirement protein A [Plantactinospora soyae]|uniref:Low temperature requirement protein LtrA n=1 Tax=Plantactinospora soyae TaxID=1544732 RepID=A0A927MFM7_9ACTN|nr:low temperature requirement protein A [Plantactinospora soyae]MBE1490270.1 low temperature requirement protein LtrA [Plantactinospora soyae]